VMLIAVTADQTHFQLEVVDVLTHK
jgi:hypothetical protein